MVHFDERGMAFHAFGYAKATKEPVALVVTSGTAVANLYPAIMSAAHERVPLIVITADRQPELRECGANQTADQVKIFSECMLLPVCSYSTKVYTIRNTTYLGFTRITN